MDSAEGVEMGGSPGLCGWALSPSTSVLRRERPREVGHGIEGGVTLEVEPGVTWPQAKERTQPSEVRWNSPPRASGGRGPC